MRRVHDTLNYFDIPISIQQPNSRVHAQFTCRLLRRNLCTPWGFEQFKVASLACVNHVNCKYVKLRVVLEEKTSCIPSSQSALLGSWLMVFCSRDLVMKFNLIKNIYNAQFDCPTSNFEQHVKITWTANRLRLSRLRKNLLL